MLPRSSQRYETHREPTSLPRTLRRLAGFLVLVFLSYQLVTLVFIASVEQESISMEPTLNRGDRLFAVPLLYGPRIRLMEWVLPGFQEPARGDLALVKPGYSPELGFSGRVADPFVRFFTLERRRLDDGVEWNSSRRVKRIVGLPGDTLRMERFVAYVRPAGETEFVSEFALSTGEYELIVDERPGAWQPLDPFGPAFEQITLGEAEYFVLSDNRSVGTDSRHWGVVGRDRILSRIWIRFWPLGRFGRP